MTKLLEKRDAIYGFCTVWVILFHVFRRISMPYIPVVTNIVGIGNMAVDVFFFLSGLSLCLSAEKHSYLENGWKDYYQKRCLRILLPYAIICIPYYLWAAVEESSGRLVHRALKFFADLFSASFWLKGTQTTWFVYGIMLFYILFPLIYRIVRKKKPLWNAAVLVGTAAFAVLASYAPLLKNGVVVWARLPVFYAGVMTGFLEEDRPMGKWMISVAAIVLLAVGAVTSASELSETFTVRPVFRLLLYFPMTLSLLIIFREVPYHGKLLGTIGSVSLEMYLIHVTLLHPIKRYGIMASTGYWLYLILPVISLILSLAVRQLEEGIRRLQGLGTEQK